MGEQITLGMGKSCRGMPAPKYPHSTGIKKKICIRVSSHLGQNSKQVGEQMPEHVHSQTSCLSEDHHRCQHSRWTDALTADSGHVQSQPCLSGGSPQGGVRSQI